MSILSLDLTIDILCRLPVKSLLRFRCVSKGFCSLIDSPLFIKLYLNHSVETCTNFSLILPSFDDLKILSVDFPTLDNAVELHHDLPFKHDKTYKVLGSCNGLLALYNCEAVEEGFSLWNPSTKTHQILLKFWKDFDVPFHFYDGFGYDDVTDDYKIVRVMQVHSTNHTVVIIYSLKGNSRRVINYVDFPHQFYFPNIQGFGVLADGSLHWKVNRLRKFDKHQLIMAFDLLDEEFREVKLPVTTIRDHLITMAVLGDAYTLAALMGAMLMYG